jgi:hypothetical protein
VSAIKKLYDAKVLPKLKDRKIETHVFTELTKMISSAYSNNVESDESFCFKFNLPITAVNNLYKVFDLSPLETGIAYKTDWGSTLTAMHNDPYYQILLLLIYYGITEKKENFTKNTLMVLLLKIWNGRKSHFFKFCDKRIMKYVVSHMLTNRHVLSKYENPVSLLKDYFVPTILEKYTPEIDKDIFKLKRLFEQCFARVRQIFAFNARTNLQTGKPEAQGGLLPLYMKAREEGSYISITNTNNSSEDNTAAGYEEYATTHNRDEIVSKTVDYIVLNKSANYPNSFIDTVNRKTNVSVKIIEKLLSFMHTHTNYEILQNLVVLILSRCNIDTFNDICQGGFSASIQKNVISSKNNEETKNIQRLIDSLLEKFFKEQLRTEFDRYSVVHKIKIRNVIVFALEYNLFRVNCRGVS